MREATTDEVTRWDELIAANPDGGNVLQVKAFGETKSKHGWTARYLMFDKLAALALVRNCPFGFGEYWYLPKGPGVKDQSKLSEIVSELAKTKAFAVKIDPELVAIDSETFGLKKVRDIQYNTATIIVDLKAGEDEVLASFKQKTRYNIRLAERKGVTVKPVETTAETIDQFYKMALETYQRAGVYVRDKQYFSDFWKLHSEQGTGQMFMAHYQNQLVAGAFISFIGSKALYKDGASYRDHSEVQAPYLLQWGIMKWLKQKGIEQYDLHGVPPKDQIDNSNHPLAGLARFKTGFNSEVTEYAGTYDIVLKKGSYALWRLIGERLAMAYESRAKKRLFY